MRLICSGMGGLILRRNNQFRDYRESGTDSVIDFRVDRNGRNTSDNGADTVGEQRRLREMPGAYPQAVSHGMSFLWLKL